MQNPHFGSKIQISKNMSKSTLQIIYSCSLQKTTPKNTKIFEKWDHVENRPSCKAYSPCKNLTLGQKVQILKNQSKSNLQIIYSCSVQKAAPKNTKYSTNETIFKIGHHAKAIAHAKSSLWVKNSNSKKHVKTHSTNHLELLSAKYRSKKTPNIWKIRPCWKSAIMQSL